MKKAILLFTVSLFILPLCAQFTAELTDVQRGNKKTYIVKSDGAKYRYDFEEDGIKGVVIVNSTAEQTALLFPEKKQVLYGDLTSSMSLMGDPFQAFRFMQTMYDTKQAGMEKIMGFDTEKLELYMDEKIILTAWYSDELGFLLKMINHIAENTYMELTNIQQGKIDADLFIIPDDYIEVDDQMRIKIPEPPPPESWKTIEATLPIDGEFIRGDRITFKVPVGERYRIILKNKTAEPAKIIRTSMKDGKELSEDKQGPASFRTTRLYKEETSSVLYIGDAGNDVIINVHEGKMHIEVFEEKR